MLASETLPESILIWLSEKDFCYRDAESAVARYREGSLVASGE